MFLRSRTSAGHLEDDHDGSVCRDASVSEAGLVLAFSSAANESHGVDGHIGDVTVLALELLNGRVVLQVGNGPSLLVLVLDDDTEAHYCFVLFK